MVGSPQAAAMRKRLHGDEEAVQSVLFAGSFEIPEKLICRGDGEQKQGLGWEGVGSAQVAAYQIRDLNSYLPSVRPGWLFCGFPHEQLRELSEMQSYRRGQCPAQPPCLLPVQC
jgi:hypothetical protein